MFPPHPAKKIGKNGRQITALKWFKNYLSCRSQYVDLNGVKSDALSIDISVIQGSILGPILFLCYINDFYSATTLFSVLFADDTIGLGKGKKHDELTAYVNFELKKSQIGSGRIKWRSTLPKLNSLSSEPEGRE
jgi:hypothetical protein